MNGLLDNAILNILLCIIKIKKFWGELTNIPAGFVHCVFVCGWRCCRVECVLRVGLLTIYSSYLVLIPDESIGPCPNDNTILWA